MEYVTATIDYEITISSKPNELDVILIETINGWYRPNRTSMKTWVAVLVIPSVTYTGKENIYAITGNSTNIFRRVDEISPIKRMYCLGKSNEILYRKALMCISATGDIWKEIKYEKGA